MVRLKAKVLSKSSNLTSISIPYGAIKRGLLLYKSINIYEFQFLMVRLKVLPFIAKFIAKNGISIPYGAIKRSSSE